MKSAIKDRVKVNNMNQKMSSPKMKKKVNLNYYKIKSFSSHFYAKMEFNILRHTGIGIPTKIYTLPYHNTFK